MTTVIYDGTYEGWLTAVFEIFEYKLKDVFFAKRQEASASLFSPPHEVITNDGKAERVMKGLKQRLSAPGLRRIYRAFLSGEAGSDEILWRYVAHVFSSTVNIEKDYSNPSVWKVKQISMRVKHEAHQMEAFVRFKLTKDQLYYALIEPDHNVLPLIAGHFKGRYADQRWLIYDMKRKYGIYYDLQSVTTVEIDFNSNVTSSRFIAEISDEREEFFQELWRKYFSSVNIAARKNIKLQVNQMPRRYWKYMTEKC
jgi:probable DNA metabolism protein